jgi:hypothetical protein
MAVTDRAKVPLLSLKDVETVKKGLQSLGADGERAMATGFEGSFLAASPIFGCGFLRISRLESCRGTHKDLTSRTW